MKNKKILTILSILLLLAMLGLVGCGGGTPKEDPQGETQEQVKEAPTPDYPTKALEYICWSGPGAPNDVMTREIARLGEKYFGKPIPVVNKPGGSGAVALSYFLGRPNDGYSIMGVTRTFVLGTVNNEVPYTHEQFEGITQLVGDPFIWFVPPDSPFNNLEEVIAYAKEHPGELTLAIPGRGAHFEVALNIEKAAGIDLKEVVYDSADQIIPEIMGGHLDIGQSNPVAIEGPAKAGKLKAIGLTSDEPLESWPEISTFINTGVNYSDYHWRGIVVQKGMPEYAKNKLIEVFNTVKESPEWAEFLRKSHMTKGKLSGDDWTNFLNEEFKRGVEFSKANDLTIQSKYQ